MNYFKDDSYLPRRWALGALLLYVMAVAAMLVWVGIDLPAEPEKQAILVELTPLAQEQPQPAPVPEAPQHDAPSTEESTEQIRGEEPQTRTINQRALFKQSQSGVDEPESAANSKAKEAKEESASGRGLGSAPKGSDLLDRGLQGRGLVGDLPRPSYKSNSEGKVVVWVEVDASGRVTSATYRQAGSTTSDQRLIDEALRAARQARFTESSAPVQGGEITYIFKMQR